MYHQHVLQYSRLKDTFMKIYHRWMYYTGLSIIMKLIRNNMLHFMTNIASVYKVHVHEIDIRMYLLRHMLTKKEKKYIYIFKTTVNMLEFKITNSAKYESIYILTLCTFQRCTVPNMKKKLKLKVRAVAESCTCIFATHRNNEQNYWQT